MGRKISQIDRLVDSLSDNDAREQLRLAYLHMERCLRALRGEDVEPVHMLDTEDGIAEELFWQCVKCSDELDYLNDGSAVGFVIPAVIEYCSTCDLMIERNG